LALVAAGASIYLSHLMALGGGVGKKKYYIIENLRVIPILLTE